MPNLEFEHLKIPHEHSGKAKLGRGGAASLRSRQNEANPQQHSDFILGKSRRLNDYWRQIREERQQRNEPELPPEVPMLIQVDPRMDLDAVRSAFDFEIVAEYEDGYLVVANDDLNFSALEEKLNKLISGQRGGGNAAKIYDLADQEDQRSRLSRILSDDLLASWADIDDETEYTVDVGIECLGKIKEPSEPVRRPNDTDQRFAEKERKYREKIEEMYFEWDALKSARETLLGEFVENYSGTIGSIIDGETNGGVFALSDSFTARITINGKGLKDLALNYPFVFEITSPDNISNPISKILGPNGEITAEFDQPTEGSPAVCVIDSGVQHNHPLLINAVNPEHSFCLVPGEPTTLGDQVRPHGHGTRVAGAVLFPNGVPRAGRHLLKCFIQNARVLNQNNGLSNRIFPPDMVKTIVERYNSAEFGNTKIFNHSISASRPCHVKQMSAWAASIDLICYERDILFVQCTGNLPETSNDPIQRGILEHIQNRDTYPNYLLRRSSRIANPAQSLSALTVGSVSNPWTDGTRNSFSNRAASPSAFTRTGLGIWDDIKPEVVEFGGDLVTDGATPPLFTTPSEVCPELVRAQNTLGPHFSSDEVGTSYATPKVTSIAVEIQKEFPLEPATFYKALIVQSARWPDWAFNDHDRNNWANYIRYFGFGIPSLGRAIANNEHRVSLHTSGEIRIKAGDIHVYHIPIPTEIATQANEQRILIEATLVYAAKPRRTRRKPRGYLGTWVDWVTSEKNQRKEVFLGKVTKEHALIDEENSAIPWGLGMRSNVGDIDGTRRNLGTTQKDWAIVQAHELPNSFCIAVRGHKGWDAHPDSYAKYSLVISFESLDRDLLIYDPIRVEVENLNVEVEPVEL